MQLKNQDLQAVRNLCELIENRPALTSVESQKLKKRHFSEAASGMLSGQTYGEATGHRGMVDPSGGEEEFRQRLRSIDNNLSEHIEIVRDGVTHYYESGMYPAPYYAWRIAIILRKAKAYSLELRFLEAWNARRSDGLGKRYQDLAAREEKARTLAKNHG
ncbi:hypothetical protein [Rhodovibrio salinarum]|uniref:Uncharacterized protein n=1 Tax=Rhodovibrio salinarum TaxID=1087 RepID=A0A934QFA7_9PROT|nr:hypothetical protein [Rhodovibrio salinarum]MBK1695784.1 hypothetical protein [Rhodovibrio salinarum]